jgi:hypothetical protein
MFQNVGKFSHGSQPRNLVYSPPDSQTEQICASVLIKKKAVPLHAMVALGGRGGIAPTHSRPRH